MTAFRYRWRSQFAAGFFSMGFALSVEVGNSVLVGVGYAGKGADRGGVFVGYARECGDGVFQLAYLACEFADLAVVGLNGLVEKFDSLFYGHACLLF